MARGKVDLDDIEHFVLDEGDQMIDLGFLPPIRRIFEALPQSSQTVFFSATMPDEMKRLAETFLTDPVTIRPNAPVKPSTPSASVPCWCATPTNVTFCLASSTGWRANRP